MLFDAAEVIRSIRSGAFRVDYSGRWRVSVGLGGTMGKGSCYWPNHTHPVTNSSGCLSGYVGPERLVLYTSTPL